jgi:hypothetical protein
MIIIITVKHCRVIGLTSCFPFSRIFISQPPSVQHAPPRGPGPGHRRPLVRVRAALRVAGVAGARGPRGGPRRAAKGGVQAALWGRHRRRDGRGRRGAAAGHQDAEGAGGRAAGAGWSSARAAIDFCCVLAAPVLFILCFWVC